MRILHVIPSISPKRGGPSAVMTTLAAALADRGHDVVVASTDDDGPRHRAPPSVSPRDGVTYRVFPRQLTFYTFSWPLTRWLIRETSTFQVVHIHAAFSYPSSAAAVAARRSRVPFILRPLGTLGAYGVGQRRRQLKWISLRLVERRMVSAAAAIQCTSAAEAAEIRQMIPQAKCIVVPNPVAPPRQGCDDGATFTAAHPELRGRPIILYLGRIDPKKGLEILFAAAARLADVSTARLVICGDGERAYVASLRDLARRLGLADRITWTGFLQGDRRWEALGAATVFVLPSLAENFGISAVEAMLAERPVIVSDQVGIHDEITAAGCGLVFDGTSTELERKMLSILQDPNAAARLSARGKAFAEARYAPARIAEILEDAYLEAVGT
jgi:glycosyltransferase involved in cell wall biosynthesis